jgi:transposase
MCGAGGLALSVRYVLKMAASIEPARTKAYSSDIVLRVMWQRCGMDLTFKEIAFRLQIGVGTAHRLYSRFVQTGDVAPLQRSLRPNSRQLDNYHELLIISLIHENPTLYLREICQKISDVTNVVVSPSTICRVLQRNGYSRKKLQQIATQRSVIYRGDFMAQVLLP